MPTTLLPIITGTPGNPPTYNVGMAETFSWVPVNNNANRPLFARAGYIVNLSDLSISLSASNLNIGGVEILDGDDHTISATVVNDPVNGNSVQVQTQDLESSIDDITIGDKQGHYADVNSTLSALNVYPVVPSGGYTLCETRTSGYPTFTSKEILIHNSTNSDVNVTLTLTSGLSCRVPIGKSAEPNHILRLNVAVSAVNIYSGCEVTFFA